MCARPKNSRFNGGKHQTGVAAINQTCHTSISLIFDHEIYFLSKEIPITKIDILSLWQVREDRHMRGCNPRQQLVNILEKHQLWIDN